jgi:hypothetical protein
MGWLQCMQLQPSGSNLQSTKYVGTADGSSLKITGAIETTTRGFNDFLYINKTHWILLYSVSTLSPENFEP